MKTPQISQGWCKIDGHNLPKFRKGFQKAQELQKSEASKNARFQKGLDEKRIAEIRRDLDNRFLLTKKQRLTKKVIRAIYFFVVLGGLIALALYFFNFFNNYETNIQIGAEEMIWSIEDEGGERYLDFVEKGNRALENNLPGKAAMHFRDAENIFPKGKWAVEGLAIAYARQCIQENKNCKKASNWLKHAWTKNHENDVLLAYLRLVQISKS